MEDEEKWLYQSIGRDTLPYMNASTLTIRIDKELATLLDAESKRSGCNRSDIARETLRRQLRVKCFNNIRRRVLPFAEASGYQTDDDIFAVVL